MEPKTSNLNNPFDRGVPFQRRGVGKAVRKGRPAVLEETIDEEFANSFRMTKAQTEEAG